MRSTPTEPMVDPTTNPPSSSSSSLLSCGGAG